MICHYCLVKRYCLTPLKYTPTTTALDSIRNTVSHTNNRRCHTNNFAPRPRWLRSEANSSRCHSEIITSLELPSAVVLLSNGPIRKRNCWSQMLQQKSTGKIKTRAARIQRTWIPFFAVPSSVRTDFLHNMYSDEFWRWSFFSHWGRNYELLPANSRIEII